MVKQCYYQNVLYVVVRNQDLRIKNQELSRILGSLGLKTPLSKSLLFGDIFF